VIASITGIKIASRQEYNLKYNLAQRRKGAKEKAKGSYSLGVVFHQLFLSFHSSSVKSSQRIPSHSLRRPRNYTVSIAWGYKQAFKKLCACAKKTSE